MIIGIAGAAGSGKDTVAGFISKYSSAVSIAQADPMKRFAKDVFNFTEHQLWGPSEARNGVDERYLTSPAWTEAAKRLMSDGMKWVQEVLPDLDVDAQYDAFNALVAWFIELARVHGFEFDEAHNEMKPTIELLFGIERQLTCRYVLQTIGTEWGRQFSSDMWNTYSLRAARKLLAGGCYYSRAKGVFKPMPGSSYVQNDPEFVCITDVRFRNELLGIHETGGMVLNVQSPSESNAAVEAAGVKGHRSEAEMKGIPSHWYDYLVINDKSRGLLALENCVHTLVNSLKSAPPKYSTTFPDGTEYEAYEVIGSTQSS
jgi:hypothetical protein